MLESAIESKAVTYAKSLGCEAYKLTGRSDPDRLFIIPDRGVLFVEFKAPGKKPADHQKREHARLRSKGFWVYVIDSFEDFKTAIHWELEE